MPNNVNYVKFQRGTITAYNLLKSRQLIDSNTLYFIYESADKKNGYLYLGDKLISGSGSGTNITKLSDISDVLENVTDAGAFLVKNDSGKWESRSLADVGKNLKKIFILLVLKLLICKIKLIILILLLKMKLPMRITYLISLLAVQKILLQLKTIKKMLFTQCPIVAGMAIILMMSICLSIQNQRDQAHLAMLI